MTSEFKFYKMTITIDMDCGDGCTTLWLYSIPLNYTLENG